MIRKMEECDIEAVMEVEALCFINSWSLDMVLYELCENPFGHFYVLCEDDKIIGFIDFWITFEICQLAKIAIHPNYQESGFSNLLMDKMIQVANVLKCEVISLEVRVSNKKAKCLYRSHAFIDVNIRKGYYSDNGEDAIVMCKALGGNWK